MRFNECLINFDYAIKYLLRDKHDFSIVEGFISALLKSIGYQEVKIVALLESESDREDSILRRSLADLIVEDANKHKYIIEIERSTAESYIIKSCFTTSRVILDSLGSRQDYSQIKKVFHIILKYFPIDNDHGPIYHEIETKEKLSVHIKDPVTQEVFDATNIFPEYLSISVPQFNDRLEREIDDWLYVLKYNNIPKEVHSSYMQQVVEKLTYLKLSPEERAEHDYYLRKLYSDRDALEAAVSRGKARGEARGEAERKAEGEAEEKRDIAKKMLKKGFEIKVIEELTGLSSKDIEELK
jgi:predicted transposase/invertase (TIGR01784 family)